jgi:hypothetical protein
MVYCNRQGGLRYKLFNLTLENIITNSAYNKIYWEHMKKDCEDGINDCPFFLEHLLNNNEN